MDINKPEDLVSICMPIYCPKHDYLNALLQSIAKQTYSNIEVIVSDDGDSESLFLALDNFPYKLRYYKNTLGKGIFNNLNNAISFVNGAYVQIVCQDDILLPSMIEAQLTTLNKYEDAGFVYTQVTNVDSSGNVIGKGFGEGSSVIPKNRLYDYLFAYGCLPGNLSTVMMKRELMNRVGTFNTKQPFGADFEYWIRCAAYSSLAINLTPQLQLRTHSEQASFTLSATYYIKDMQENLKLLLSKISFNRKVAIQYSNCQYNVSCLKRALYAIRNNKAKLSIVLLCNQFPFNISKACWCLIFKNKKINLKQYVPFPIQ